MPENRLTDKELVAALPGDGLKAFNALFNRHWKKVYTVAFQYVRQPEAAMEITHDIFLNIWNKRSLLQIRHFGSYVITAASYHGIRKKQNLQAVPIQYLAAFEQHDDGEYVPAAGSDTNQGEARIRSEELDSAVNTLLDGLPRRCKEVYLLSRQQHLSIAEIASRLNISKRTVENQLTAALKHLRSGLKSTLLLVLLLGSLSFFTRIW